jgi:hypothetical protein
VNSVRPTSTLETGGDAHEVLYRPIAEWPSGLVSDAMKSLTSQ